MDLIESPLGRTFDQDGVTVTVSIYKSADSKWILEVENSERTSIVWDDHFESDSAAWQEFERTVAEEGMAAFD